MTENGQPSPAELRHLAERVAGTAAEYVADRIGSTMTTETKSSPVDLVTEVDRASEALIVSMIQKERPDDSIVGEEGTAIVGSSGVSWILDPIDGTTNFVYNYPGFGVSVGVQCDGLTVAGAVVDIMQNCDLYSAALHEGATRNGAAIHASSLGSVDTALVATGFSFDGARRGRQAMVLAELLPRIRDIRRQGSAAVDLCSVACGRVDAYFEKGLNLWDLAAGALIASEAGARVSVEEVDGEYFTVATGPNIANAFFALLDQTRAAAV